MNTLFTAVFGDPVPINSTVKITCPYAGEKCGKKAIVIKRVFPSPIPHFDVFRLRIIPGKEDEGETVTRGRVLRVCLDGQAEVSFLAGRVALRAEDEGEIVMRSRVLRVCLDGQAEVFFVAGRVALRAEDEGEITSLLVRPYIFDVLLNTTF